MFAGEVARGSIGEAKHIVREPDGLALSSRNIYLSPAQRTHALVLSRAVRQAEALAASGERRASVLIQTARATFAAVPEARVDYIELVNWSTLEPVETAIPGTLFVPLPLLCRLLPYRRMESARFLPPSPG